MRETKEDKRKKKTTAAAAAAAVAVSCTGAEEEEHHLQRLLQRAVAILTREKDFTPETLEKVIRALENGASEKKKKKTAAAVPENFVCPLSGELMRDPVIVSSGQTYDRPFIQAWLDQGNLTCPKSQQVLSPSTLIPNHLVLEMITNWSSENGIEIPPHDRLDGIIVTQSERAKLDHLLKKINSISSITDQKQAAKELRRLTKTGPSFRALLGEKPCGISQLIAPLASLEPEKHPDFQEDVVTTILNLSIYDSNKKIVGENSQAIPLLINAVKTGTMTTRSNAAAALFTLSALDENKIRIGELGAFAHLLRLLEEGDESAKKDAASAIFILCMAQENKSRAIGEGLVRVLLKCINDEVLVNEVLAMLALVATNNDKALDEVIGNGGVSLLLGLIRSSGDAKARENAVVVLHSVCAYNRSTLREIKDEEYYSRCISWLAQNGTARARRKAGWIFDRVNKGRGMYTPFGTP